MKKIWIINHYAGEMYLSKGGRHFWFSKYLLEEGYKLRIFCSNIRHSPIQTIVENNKETKTLENVPFTFIKSRKYKGNGLSRIINMYSFYKKMIKTGNKIIKKGDKPDIIIASSVHPLSLQAGLKLGKRHNIPVIVEVRDLWPESIVVYSNFTKKNPIIKWLYKKEREYYEKADKVLFTMEGGKDYIINQKWDVNSGGKIKVSNIVHINNGVDLDGFNKNILDNKTDDPDLFDEKFKVIYAGSIRKVNNVKKIIDTAKIVSKQDKNIRFLIYGDGDEKEKLVKYVKEQKIPNVIFKGRVNKEQVPFILSKADLNIFHEKKSELNQYGVDFNKLFEYFASGKPVTTDCEFGYDIIKKFNAGIVVDDATEEEWAEEIIKIKNLDKNDYNKLCNNSLKAAREYDFKKLTKDLINVIEDIL